VKKFAWVSVAGVLLVTTACTGPLFPGGGPKSPEAFCATLPSVGFGHLFYCGTVQGNAQGGLPNGWTGYCMPADTNNLGLVGYGALFPNGGKAPVQSFDGARQDCQLGGGCSSVIQCTRE
jgi:hypothetical protein